MSNSENLTDFRKTVETGMGPGFLQNIFFILLNLFWKLLLLSCYLARYLLGVNRSDVGHKTTFLTI